MMDKETRFESDLRVLNYYYNEFYIEKVQYFLSFFDNVEEKNIMVEKYKDIVYANKERVISIQTNDELNTFLVEPFKKMLQENPDKKHFENYTFIIDVMDNLEKPEMLKSVLNLTWLLKGESCLKMHYIGNLEDPRDLAGRDLWEFRTHTFFYEKGELTKVLFKQEMEISLEEKTVPVKKNKL